MNSTLWRKGLACCAVTEVLGSGNDSPHGFAQFKTCCERLKRDGNLKCDDKKQIENLIKPCHIKIALVVPVA